MRTGDPSPGNHRLAATLVGVLFINAIVFLFVGEALYRPVLDAPNLLEIAHPNRVPVVAGVLLEWVASVPLIALIPVLLFPVLRPHSEVLALGYLVLRLLEVALLSLADINKLALVMLSRDFLEAGSGAGDGFAPIVAGLRAQTHWVDSAGLIYIIVFGIGSLMLYVALYRYRLVPRAISALGLFAAVLLMAGAVWAEFFPLSAGVGPVIWGPIALTELSLAVWLIVRGFSTDVPVPATSALP